MISATISRAGSSFGNLLNPGQSARNAARGWNAITGRLERSLKCYYSIRSVLGVSPDKRRNPVLTKELISLRTMCSITALTENTSSFRNLNLSSGADLSYRLSFFFSYPCFNFFFWVLWQSTMLVHIPARGDGCRISRKTSLGGFRHDLWSAIPRWATPFEEQALRENVSSLATLWILCVDWH
jgi:hypothetical protein